MHASLMLIAGFAAALQGTAIVGREIELTGEYLRVTVDPGQAGAITKLSFVGSTHNLAAGHGLLQEGFGARSLYVPNRRLNERLEILDDIPGRPVLRFTYDCDGPNIRGLRVTRLIEPLRNEASIRVTWRIENRGDEAHWVAPWVRNEVAPGGTVDAHDRVDMPTLRGIEQPTRTRYEPAARNWIALTDPVAQETLYGVFEADHLHSFQAIAEHHAARLGFTAIFLPRVMAPGAVWETTYRIGVVRGLTHVDFATDEMAVQLDYQDGELTLLMSAATAMDDVEIRASVLDSAGQAARLRTKRFSIAPDRLVRSRYVWNPVDAGPYDFLAELRRDGQVIDLGADTSPPHGGIDTRLTLGGGASHFEPWTDAPFVLDHGSRTLERTMAAAGDTAIWFESSLEKIFREDVPKPVGRIDPAVRLSLARNEHESFQVVIRPPEGEDWRSVQFRLGALTDSRTGHTLPRDGIRLARVGYVPVRIPTHFESATGLYPDPLPPLTPFTAKGGQCNPVWITIYAPRETPAGTYEGILEILSANADPVELWVKATVFAFTLPVRPTLKTDFGFDLDTAVEACNGRGYTGTPEVLEAAYADNALEHRVTLRGPNALPPATFDYASDLGAFAARLEGRLAAGLSTIAVPRSLIETPGILGMAEDFIVNHELQDLAFCLFDDEPSKPSWDRLLDDIEIWRAVAPSIPATVPTFGREPFFAETCGIWTIHSPVFDTVNNRMLLAKIAEGREVWWYVNHSPPRPYGNFFIDFTGVEHRILFWQAWALGIRGFHYPSVNDSRPGQDPYTDPLGYGPANGNGRLVYPGPAGPVNSIRWEIIRDGIEDYDYLKILGARIRAVKERGGHEALLAQAARVTALDAIIPNLVTFTRDASALQTRRDEIGRMIVELNKALAIRAPW